MQTVLNTRIYVEGDARERTKKSLESQVQNLVGDLDFSYELQVRQDDRVEVLGAGDDAEAAVNLLERRFGVMETDPRDGETYLGTLEAWSDEGFTVDVGRDALVPPESLEELGKGTPHQIRERYGLVQHVPLEVVWGDPPRLSDDQVDALWGWRKGSGRVNVNSVTRSEIRATVNRAGHAHDIEGVERLGLLEQSVVCSSDTDPPGLLASLGRFVQGEMKCVVN